MPGIVIDLPVVPDPVVREVMVGMTDDDRSGGVGGILMPGTSSGSHRHPPTTLTSHFHPYTNAVSMISPKISIQDF